MNMLEDQIKDYYIITNKLNKIIFKIKKYQIIFLIKKDILKNQQIN